MANDFYVGNVNDIIFKPDLIIEER